MILGLGHDLVDFSRIEALLDKYGDRFPEKYFTEAEADRAEKMRSIGGHVAVYAKRFAAKEAASKALGTGFADGVFMRDIGVQNNEAGQPTLILTGGALERLKSITPEGMTHKIHLTITDEPPMASAVVMIEAIS